MNSVKVYVQSPPLIHERYEPRELYPLRMNSVKINHKSNPLSQTTQTPSNYDKLYV